MKINDYSVDGSPSLTDKLIGTDSLDSNITKNYEISDILNLSYQATSQLLGFNRFDDNTYTELSPLSISSGSTSVLLNDGLKFSLIVGNNVFYDISDDYFKPINENDVYTVSLVFKAKCNNTNNGHIQLFMSGPGEYNRLERSISFAKGNNEEQNFHEIFQFYADPFLVSNYANFNITSVGANVSIYDIIFFIQRNQIGV